ncbi:serine/threonine-protein kinase [Spatholobus suberectus]|nr:serine/threonine-protein kinase [Spatholobus suberectus]
MGCVISREVSKGIISEVKEEKGLSGESKRKVDGVSGSKGEVVEVQNGEREKEKEKGGGGERVQRPRGERRRSKANPRLSNPPKHLRGEQVAAGWPPWLTAVCGEALSGWIPRKADTFEKIDKVEQLHKIYKLCGSPSDEYWKKSKLPNATLFKPREPYKRRIRETFKDFPPSALPLIDTLLAIDPVERKTASDALRSEFFTTEPYACDPSSLPKYPPSKEMDAKRRDDEMRRLRAAGKAQVDGPKKHRTRDRAVKAFPAPEANAELQSNIDRRRLITHANAKSKSEKFPPPHQDGQLGFPLGSSHHIDPDTVPTDVSFTSTSYTYSKEPFQAWSGPIGKAGDIGVPKRKKHTAGDALDLSKPQKDALKDKLKGKKIIA